MEFHENLKKRRLQMGLTQYQLGEKLNLAESTISLYEAGKRFPDKETLKRLSVELQTPISVLMGENGKKNRIPVLGVVPAGIPIEAISTASINNIFFISFSSYKHYSSRKASIGLMLLKIRAGK